MIARYIHAVLIICLWPLATAGKGIDLNEDFRLLDEAVAQRATYAKQKEASIQRTKMSLGECTSFHDLYNANRRLYNEYLKFNSDSAIAYAYRCLVVARKGNMSVELASAKLALAKAWLLRGEDVRAKAQLNNLGPIELNDSSLRTGIASAWLDYILRTKVRHIYDGRTRRYTSNDSLWRSYWKYLPEGSWSSVYYESQFTDKPMGDKINAFLKGVQQPSVEAALIYVAMARQSYLMGDERTRCHYLILSAINDIKTANHEAGSLMYVLYTPYVDKASRRAADYAEVCTENVNIYKDVGRSLAIVNIHSLIANSYEEKLEKRGTIMLMTIMLLMVAIFFVVIFAYFLRKRGQRQIKILTQMREMNMQMQTVVDNEKRMQDKLRENNATLADEIGTRDKNFMDVYMLVTQYISDVREFKKSIFNLITAGKIDKARRDLASNTNIEKYLSGFYKQFDTAFMLSHPDFIDRLNTLLRPECRITLTDERTLTPELRIFALVSIGMTDSVSIAEFLHYSPQTIYNYRLRMRRNACVPEKSFTDEVASFYKERKVKE